VEFYLLFHTPPGTGIATAYGLDDRGFGVRIPVSSRIFSSTRCSDRPLRPPSLLSNRYQGLFPGGEVAGAWSWSLTSTSAEVKKMWIYTSTPP
jgi:hypothetical protein